MPCNDGGTMGRWYEEQSLIDEREKHRKTQERLDLATRLLCGLMTKLEASEPQDGFTWEELVSEELKSWWVEHRKWDEERIRLEEATKAWAEQVAAQQALDEIQSRIKKIKELGGSPTPKLTMELAVAQGRVDEANKSSHVAKPALAPNKPTKRAKASRKK